MISNIGSATGSSAAAAAPATDSAAPAETKSEFIYCPKIFILERISSIT